ncbi:uncharacterized protein LOC135399066 isoform X2 [Ornithodoros turicata]|uniref:uncharacterized protein LOC135399066 isoform X2 n=1 Tax=Ornithodoros turicata TaxID=34597 RepID=UPI00313880D2
MLAFLILRFLLFGVSCSSQTKGMLILLCKVNYEDLSEFTEPILLRVTLIRRSVPFSAHVHCHNNETQLSTALLHDGNDTTCLTLPICASSLRITLDTTAYVSHVRIVCEPLPRTVYYVPWNLDSFLASPNGTTANTWYNLQHSNATIHSVDIADIRKACEVTLFDMGRQDAQHSSLASGGEATLITCVTLSIMALIALVVICIVCKKCRHKMIEWHREHCPVWWSLGNRHHSSTGGSSYSYAGKKKCAWENKYHRAKLFEAVMRHNQRIPTVLQHDREQAETYESENTHVMSDVQMANALLLANSEPIYDDTAVKSTLCVQAVVDKCHKANDDDAENYAVDL